jgi:hypothetical protein
MAGCEQGYLCVLCGQDVEGITESALYLRYVLGEVDWSQLHRAPEAHIRCDKSLAQFIVDASFEPVICDGAFAKCELDPEFVTSEEARVTAGYRRLRSLAQTSSSIAEYPLPDVIARRRLGVGEK